MRWPKGWSRFALNRRVLTDLRRTADAAERQAAALEALLAHFAPTFDPPTDDADLRAHSGVSFSRDDEQAAVEAYKDRVREATGHIVSDEEIAHFLDERDGKA